MGEILLDAPIDEKIENLKVKDWNNEKITEKFRELRFNRFLDRFNLINESVIDKQKNIEDIFSAQDIKINDEDKINEIIKDIRNSKELIYSLLFENLDEKENIINKTVKAISIYNKAKNTAIYISVDRIENFKKYFTEIFEDANIKKVGY